MIAPTTAYVIAAICFWLGRRPYAVSRASLDQT